MADIDVYDPGLDDEIVKAAGFLGYECRRRGMRFTAGAAGSLGHPENRFEARVEQEYQSQLMNHGIGQRLRLQSGRIVKAARSLDFGTKSRPARDGLTYLMRIGFAKTAKRTVEVIRELYSRF